MSRINSELNRQKKIVLDAIPYSFYEALGPYEYPRFYHTFAEEKSAELGRMEVSVIEISLQETSYSELVFPDELLLTIWSDVTCKWNPEELITTISTFWINSLEFEINSSIDCDAVYLDAEADPYGIRDSYAEFITGQLIDHCMYSLDRDEIELEVLIDKQPLGLRSLIRDKCRIEVANIESER